jgi:uncharacterized protein YdaU (DUF1376 family)
MAKDPAFLFYPGDFNTGTQFFTDDQVGKYMRLLMAQHQHGHLTENQVIFICKSYDKDVMSKFVKDGNGLWYNERLEIEIVKRKKFVESRSKNKEGKSKSKIISKSYDSHMENENENENRNTINNKKESETFEYTLEPDVDVKLAEALDEIYLDAQAMKWPHLDFQFEYRTFCEKVRGSPDHYRNHDNGGIRLAFQKQLRDSKNRKNGKGFNNKNDRTDFTSRELEIIKDHIDRNR